MALFPDDDDYVRSEPSSRRAERRGSSIGWLLITGAIAGTVVLGHLPAPYVIERPGPVFDTLGEVTTEDGREQPVIEITGRSHLPDRGRAQPADRAGLGLAVSRRRAGSRSRPRGSSRAAPSSRSRRSIPTDKPTRKPTRRAPPRWRTPSRRRSPRPSRSSTSPTRSSSTASSTAPRRTACSSPATRCSTANGVAIDGITDLSAAIAENGTDRAMVLTVIRDGVEQAALTDPGAGVGRRPDADHRHPGRATTSRSTSRSSSRTSAARAPERCSRSASTTS